MKIAVTPPGSGLARHLARALESAGHQLDAAPELTVVFARRAWKPVRGRMLACVKAGDDLARAIAREASATMVTLFDVVDPADQASVVARFVRQAREGAPITVHGDGTQTRAFLRAEHAARAIAALAAREVEGSFELGGATRTTILALARRVKQLAGSRAPILRVPYERAFPDGFDPAPHRAASLDALHETIGWTPPAEDLDEILLPFLREGRRSEAR